MSLGPKKREVLVEQAMVAFAKPSIWTMRQLNCWRECVTAVVTLLLDREEARVVPLLDALSRDEVAFESGYNPLNAHRVRAVLAADAAAQADEPEPEPALVEAVEKAAAQLKSACEWSSGVSGTYQILIDALARERGK